MLRPADRKCSRAITSLARSVDEIMSNKEQSFPWFVLVLMSSVTFMGMLSELAPSGILPEMSEGLSIKAAQVGFLVGVYALASASFAIPLVSLTLAVNRKTLLIWLLVGFCVSNVMVGFTSSYYLIVFCRVVGGSVLVFFGR